MQSYCSLPTPPAAFLKHVFGGGGWDGRFIKICVSYQHCQSVVYLQLSVVCSEFMICSFRWEAAP